ncbi:hypothetical protein DSUL_20404 [Desulfovibrionales bacterium]
MPASSSWSIYTYVAILIPETETDLIEIASHIVDHFTAKSLNRKPLGLKLA